MHIGVYPMKALRHQIAGGFMPIVVRHGLHVARLGRPSQSQIRIDENQTHFSIHGGCETKLPFLLRAASESTSYIVAPGKTSGSPLLEYWLSSPRMREGKLS